jgi:hypothetical protein
MLVRPIELALLLALAPGAFPQQPAPAEAGLAALRTFASDLEKCQDALIAERHWGKARLEIERLYFSRPKNVVWKSGPAAGTGSIEFSSSIYVRVPTETAKKYTRKRVVETLDLPVTSEGVAFAPTVDGFPIVDTQYRYEFGLRSDGIALVRMLRSSPDGAWQTVETGHPCAPKPK